MDNGALEQNWTGRHAVPNCSTALKQLHHRKEVLHHYMYVCERELRTNTV